MSLGFSRPSKGRVLARGSVMFRICSCDENRESYLIAIYSLCGTWVGSEGWSPRVEVGRQGSRATYWTIQL